VAGSRIDDWRISRHRVRELFEGLREMMFVVALQCPAELVFSAIEVGPAPAGTAKKVLGIMLEQPLEECFRLREVARSRAWRTLATASRRQSCGMPCRPGGLRLDQG
jgi:hypothetical protein